MTSLIKLPLTGLPATIVLWGVGGTVFLGGLAIDLFIPFVIHMILGGMVSN